MRDILFHINGYYPFLVTRARVTVDCWRLALKKISVFFCLRDWGRGHGTGLQSLSCPLSSD